MTERTFPSGIRDAYPDELARVWRRAGGDWVVPSDEVMLADREGLSGTPLDAFGESHSGSSFDVTISAGEAVVVGVWIGKDAQTTVTLDAQVNNQTVYAGWSATAENEVIIGLDGAFSMSEPADQRLPIWEFDTDGSGVTAARDLRPLGEQIDVRNEGSTSQADHADSATDADALGTNTPAELRSYLDANDNIIYNIRSPDAPLHAANRQYVDANAVSSTSQDVISAATQWRDGGRPAVYDSTPNSVFESYDSTDNSRVGYVGFADNLQIDDRRGQTLYNNVTGNYLLVDDSGAVVDDERVATYSDSKLLPNVDPREYFAKKMPETSHTFALEPGDAADFLRIKTGGQRFTIWRWGTLNRTGAKADSAITCYVDGTLEASTTYYDQNPSSGAVDTWQSTDTVVVKLECSTNPVRVAGKIGYSLGEESL